jgi:thiosulfate/3-mercaptopyruvate sulfurtransferase
MLRYMGQDAVAVLDGGWPAWVAVSLPVESGDRCNRAAKFIGEPQADRLVRVDQVPDAPLLIDARDPTRYRGEEEPIDPVAGHIPGAINHFWQRNLDAGGRFLLPETLRAQFQGLLKETHSATAVVYCGSGVTACHNVLAMVHAGLAEPRLYGGSWSEWCADPDRPIATGDR